ncbi:hypothetical protein L7F22_034674 [Adiantum nelumboides]|nr:hypothetical protein [Adiantum nelumboides]
MFFSGIEMTEVHHEVEESLVEGVAELEREPFLRKHQESVGASEAGALSSVDRCPSHLDDPGSQLESLKFRNNGEEAEIDVATMDQRQCRICLDVGGEDLISPCRCRGTQKFVHRSCLDHWRAAKEGFAFAHCTECRTLFCLQANMPADRWWLRLKFQLLVIRDHAAIYIVVQLVRFFVFCAHENA